MEPYMLTGAPDALKGACPVREGLGGNRHPKDARRPHSTSSLGRVVATPGALRALEKAEQLPAEFLDRHVNGDWGNVTDADKQENEGAVEQGFRILSAYTTSAGDWIWVLTEADRSVTSILLPSEY
jgi:hypothetical protein